jgi:hypothetical protein
MAGLADEHHGTAAIVPLGTEVPDHPGLKILGIDA